MCDISFEYLVASGIERRYEMASSSLDITWLVIGPFYNKLTNSAAGDSILGIQSIYALNFICVTSPLSSPSLVYM